MLLGTQSWPPPLQAWVLILSPPVFTQNRKVRVSYFGAALCWESKQFCLYSLNADDEWTDGIGAVLWAHSHAAESSTTLALTRRWWKGGGWGVRRRALTCCTMHHLYLAAELRFTLQTLMLVWFVSSLRSQNEQNWLPPIFFFFILPFCGGFFFFQSEASPESCTLRHSELSAFPTGLPSCGGLVSSCSYTQRMETSSQPAGNWGSTQLLLSKEYPDSGSLKVR